MKARDRERCLKIATECDRPVFVRPKDPRYRGAGRGTRRTVDVYERGLPTDARPFPGHTYCDLVALVRAPDFVDGREDPGEVTVTEICPGPDMSAEPVDGFYPSLPPRTFNVSIALCRFTQP